MHRAPAGAPRATWPASCSSPRAPGCPPGRPNRATTCAGRSIRSRTSSPAGRWQRGRWSSCRKRAAIPRRWSVSGKSPKRRGPDPIGLHHVRREDMKTAALALGVELQVDPVHSTATFAIKHMMVSTVHGNFGKVTGTVNHDPKDPTKSSANIQIDPASLDTRVEKRDAHLKSADFFDVQKCPEMIFKSTKVEKAGDKKYKVTGDLTMHCTTKPVTLDVEGLNGPVKGPQGANLYAATATGKLSRKDFGLTWNRALEAGGVAVGDDVQLTVDLELTDSPPAARKEAQAETKPANK